MEEKKNEFDGMEMREPEETTQSNTVKEEAAEDIKADAAEEAAGDPIEEELFREVEGVEPPPIPKSVDDAWAEALGVPNNVPPIPNAQPSGNAQYTMHNAQSVRDAGDAPWRRHYSGGQQLKTENSQLKTDSEPMPSTWLVWSVVCTILCCFIPGVIAIIQSARVSSRYYAGDIEGAKRASHNAEIWIIVSFVLGVLSSTLYLPITLAGLF